MAWISLAGKAAGKLEKIWKVAARAYPDVSLSYTNYAGGPGYSTTLSPHTKSIFGIFNIQAHASNKQPETECTNGVLTAGTGVPIGDGVCEVETPKTQQPQQSQSMDVAP